MTIYKKKIILLCSIISLTVGYSLYVKSTLEIFESRNQKLILKKLPNFIVQNFLSKKMESSQHLLKKSRNGIVVHLWGTWCAPCQTEFPSFIELARRMEGTGINFIAIAVNDEYQNVQKFISQKHLLLPRNLLLFIDTSEQLISQFGTNLVPETFIFNKLGGHLLKFVGPQDWSDNEYYQNIVKKLSIK